MATFVWHDGEKQFLVHAPSYDLAYRKVLARRMATKTGTEEEKVEAAIKDFEDIDWLLQVEYPPLTETPYEGPIPLVDSKYPTYNY